MSSNEIFKDSGDCQGSKFIIFWVLNLVSFLLLGITGIVVSVDYSKHWNNWMATYFYSVYYEPFTVDDVIMYILVSIVIIISVFCFVLILLKGTVFKEQEFYDIFFNQWNKFVFVPIIITCAMFYIGNTHGNSRKAPLAVGFIFALLSAAAFGFIYNSLPNPNNNWMLFVYKKCFLSILVVFNAYFVFYDICQLAQNNHYKDGEICSYIFMPIFGLLCTAGIWFLTEVVSGLFAWLTFIGFVAYSAEGGEHRKTLRRVGELAISIIFMVIIFVELVIICIMKKQDVIH